MDATGYMLQLDTGPGSPYFYDIGNVTTFSDDFSLWTSGSANVALTSYDEPYDIDWTYDVGANAEGAYVVDDATDDYTDNAGNTTFTQNGTWDGNGFTFSPNSVQDDYNVGVSVTAAPGATGILVLIEDDVTPKAYDYYGTAASNAYGDNNTAVTPVIDITRTSIFDTALDITGNFLFSGNLVGSNPAYVGTLVLGEDDTPSAESQIFIGYGNTTTINTLSAVIGNDNVVSNDMSRMLVVGHSNSVTSSGDGYSTVVGIENTLTDDAIYANVLGWDNACASRLAAIVGQSNIIPANAPRTVAIGVGNTAGAEYGIAIGYQNSCTGSNGSAAIGWQNTVSAPAGSGFGIGNNVSGNTSFCFGGSNTTSAANSGCFGYGNNASATYAFAFGANARASTSGTIVFCSTPTSGSGSDVRFQAYTTSTGLLPRDAFSQAVTMFCYNNTERKGQVIFNVYDATAAREAVRIYTDGSNAKVIQTNTQIAQVGSLGSEKITNGTFTGSASSWTLGTGWAYSSNTVQKNANGTGTLSQTSAAMATALVPYEIYQLQYTISSWTVGTVTPSIAGVTLAAVSGNQTYTEYFTALSTADLVFTPTNTSRFTIDTISLKKVTAGNLNVVGNISSDTSYLITSQTFAEGGNIIVGTSTGTKIGTATSQKIGVWNATPIVQPTTAVTAATFAANTSGIADDTATFDGYTIGQVVKALRNIGLLA
jgi:hypothetical protein